MGPAMASSIAAESRTLRVTTCSWVSGPQYWPQSGARVVRARLGLRPTSPQHDAGMRREPPMSLPWAIGTRPAATAAAEPPLDPPGDRSRAQGLWAGPKARGSVVGDIVSSGTLVRPSCTSPAFRKRRVRPVSAGDTSGWSRSRAVPCW